MAKTQLTLDIEEALYFFEIERGEMVMEEVRMPDDWGIVDTLALRTHNDGTHEWRCYEIKVSKSDFRSSARLTFVGHYNYYVVPRDLYEQVKNEIPSHIGVMVYMPFQEGYTLDSIAKGTLTIIKKSVRQELLFPENFMMHAFTHAMFREVRKAKRLEKGLSYFSSDALYTELKLRKDGYANRLLAEVEDEAIYELQEELTATRAEVDTLWENYRSRRRQTEALL